METYIQKENRHAETLRKIASEERDTHSSEDNRHAKILTTLSEAEKREAVKKAVKTLKK